MFVWTNYYCYCIISSIINIIVSHLSLSEKIILDIKKDKNSNNSEEAVLYKLKIKFFIFSVFIYIFLTFFWYYIACFCSIYKNTQIHIVKDTLISYVLTILYPCALCLIPGLFRIPSLASKESNKECLFKFSKLLQLI